MSGQARGLGAPIAVKVIPDGVSLVVELIRDCIDAAWGIDRRVGIGWRLHLPVPSIALKARMSGVRRLLLGYHQIWCGTLFHDTTRARS
jgi:hypothetical protein